MISLYILKDLKKRKVRITKKTTLEEEKEDEKNGTEVQSLASFNVILTLQSRIQLLL